MTDAEFQAAFDQHKDAVYKFAWRMSGAEAADDDAILAEPVDLDRGLAGGGLHAGAHGQPAHGARVIAAPVSSCLVFP